MIRVNVSEILDYQTCPSLWAQKWVYRRGPLGARSPALDVGTAFHKVVAEALLAPTVGTGWFDGRISGVLAAEWRKRGWEDDTDALNNAAHLEVWLRKLWEDRPWSQVIGTEVLIERQIDPEVMVFGRLDGVVKMWNGKLRELQWKTTGAGTPFAVFSALIQRTLHESAYCWMAESKYGEVFDGTLLIAVKKLAHHVKQAGAECGDCGKKGYAERDVSAGVLVQDMVISEVLRERALRTIAAKARELDSERKRLLSLGMAGFGPFTIEQKEKACGGLHGNSLCGFINVCNGEADLTDGFLFENADPLESYKEGRLV